MKKVKYYILGGVIILFLKFDVLAKEAVTICQVMELHGVDILEEPYEDAYIIMHVDKGMRLVVSDQFENGYYQLDLGGIYGYVEKNSVSSIVEDENAKMYGDKSVTTIQYHQLLMDGSLTELERNQARDVYNLLPSSIDKYLAENNIECIFTQEESVYEGVSQEASGYTASRYSEAEGIWENVCYVKKPESILHEIGHAIDRAMGNQFGEQALSHQKTFEIIYDSEATKSYLDKYYQSTKDEYFAECFQQFLQNQQALECNMPMTCAYLKQLIQ